MAHGIDTVSLATPTCTILSDAVVIVATWVYLYKQVKSQTSNWLRHPHTLSWLFFRDGRYLMVTALHTVYVFIS